MAYQGTLTFAPAGIDACALWRMFMPHLNIPNSRFLFTEGIPRINEMAECDTLVVQRLMMEGNEKFLNIARKFGFKIIYDLDDNVWNMPNANPAKAFFKQPGAIEGLRHCSEWADAITVSTRELKREVERHMDYRINKHTKKHIPVIHIDNAVDLRIFHAPLIPRDEDKVVIGWGGSNTHLGDVADVWRLLPRLLEKYPNVFLEFAGQDPPQEIRNHERVTIRPWCHISEYANRLATWKWDIMLAPLEEHKFNESKSCIKMIEAGCIEAVCLAQDIAPYQYFASKSKGLEWCLCYIDSHWEKKLSKLIEDKSFRQDMGKQMRQNVEDNFNITRTRDQWLELQSSVLLP